VKAETPELRAHCTAPPRRKVAGHTAMTCGIGLPKAPPYKQTNDMIMILKSFSGRIVIY
jgi:hypothetical protein